MTPLEPVPPYSDTTLNLGGRTFDRGSVTTFRLPLVEAPDGLDCECNVTVLHGAQSGPVLCIAAGVHGDEVDGVNAVAELLKGLDPELLAGTLVAVPVQNPLAFRGQHRLPLDLTLKSPYDHGLADMFLEFPPQRPNTLAIMATSLWEAVFSAADYLIDLHTPAAGARYIPVAIIPAGAPAVSEEAHRLARAFGVECLMHADDEATKKLGSVAKLTHGRGKPSLLLEIGEGGRHTPHEVARAADGLRNIMRVLDMLEEQAEHNPAPAVIQGSKTLRAARAGLLRTSAELGATVAEGEEIAQILSPEGEVVETLRSPHDGLLVRQTSFPTVWAGEDVAHIARVKANGVPLNLAEDG